MRKGYKLTEVLEGKDTRTDVDATVEQFSEGMRHGQIRYQTQADYWARHEGGFRELQDALKEILEREREVLSIGAGECENEIALSHLGYRITGSDIVPEALDQLRKLFPEFPTLVLDIFDPHVSKRFDDVLMTGLDFYYADDQVLTLLRNVRTLLNPGGRVIFVLRYRDNWLTRGIDYLGIPMVCSARNMHERLRQSPRRFKLKFHGYRRTPSDVRALAEAAGFRIGRILHAGLAREFTRLYVHRLPRLYASLQRMDSKLHISNNAILFELAS